MDAVFVLPNLSKEIREHCNREKIEKNFKHNEGNFYVGDESLLKNYIKGLLDDPDCQKV